MDAHLQPVVSRSSVRARWSQRLEQGAWTGRFSTLMSAAWNRAARPVRPLLLPERATVIGVGGATLGGSGKTPLAMEIARRLASAGIPSAVAASSYRTGIRVTRPVTSEDSPESVGDEAVMMRSVLAPFGVPVVVGPRRQAAVDLAGRLAPCVIVDGLLQARPERVALSLLVVDARAPWGAGHCPPAGDLRADRRVLLDACDCVLVGLDESTDRLPEDAFEGRRTMIWRRKLERVRAPDGVAVAPTALVGRRVGLLTTVARPERLLAQLGWLGIDVVEHRRFGDHAFPSRHSPNGKIQLDLWLTTHKCVSKIGPSFEGVPVWVAQEEVAAPDALVERIIARFG